MRAVYVRRCRRGSRGEKESVPRASRTHATTEGGGAEGSRGAHALQRSLSGIRVFFFYATFQLSICPFAVRDHDNYYTGASDVTLFLETRRNVPSTPELSMRSSIISCIYNGVYYF